MQISQENIDSLNAIIRINIQPEDYREGVDKQLKEYGRRASIPGFRPGKVPSGMIRKMYGKSVLLDELNKLTNETLLGYIRDNNLKILGNPLPAESNDNAFNPDEPGEMQLAFEIGLAPEFEPALSSEHSFNLYLFKPEESDVEDLLNHYRIQLGKKEATDISAKGDIVHGILTQLDQEGNPLEGGIVAHADFKEEDMLNADAFLPFIGLKVGSEIKLNLKEVCKEEMQIARMLQISPEAAATLDTPFMFKVEEINRVIPAELDQAFFDQLYGKDKIQGVEELRARISSDLAERYKKDAFNRFFNEVVEHLVNKTAFDLPDGFMKKWLVSNSEGKMHPEDIEQNYENYARSIRWQLIEGQILRSNQIAFSSEDVLEKLTRDFLSYMGQADTDDEDMRARAKQIATGMLKNEKEVNRIYDELYRDAMTDLFHRSFQVSEVGLPMKEWVEKMNAPFS